MLIFDGLFNRLRKKRERRKHDGHLQPTFHHGVPQDDAHINLDAAVGAAYVEGSGMLKFHIRFHPSEVDIDFSDDQLPPPLCGPIITDQCWTEVENIGSMFRPRWELKVFWIISSTVDPRILVWIAYR